MDAYSRRRVNYQNAYFVKAVCICCGDTFDARILDEIPRYCGIFDWKVAQDGIALDVPTHLYKPKRKKSMVAWISKRNPTYHRLPSDYNVFASWIAAIARIVPDFVDSSHAVGLC